MYSYTNQWFLRNTQMPSSEVDEHTVSIKISAAFDL